MLVKFLSFTASVLGTTRYKPVLFSCIALLFSLTGIAAAAMWQSGQRHDASSVSGSQTASDTDTKERSPQLRSTREQATKDQGALQNTPAPTEDSSQQKPDASGGNVSGNTQTQQALGFTLSTSSLTMTPGTTNETIIASTTDKSTVTWATSPDSEAAVHIVIDQTTSASATLRIVAKGTATAGTYRLTVYAKDGVRPDATPKTITVTVTL